MGSSRNIHVYHTCLPVLSPPTPSPYHEPLQSIPVHGDMVHGQLGQPGRRGVVDREQGVDWIMLHGGGGEGGRGGYKAE